MNSKDGMIEIAVSLLSHTLPQLQISHETSVALNWFCTWMFYHFAEVLHSLRRNRRENEVLVSRAPLTESGCFADGGSFYKS